MQLLFQFLNMVLTDSQLAFCPDQIRLYFHPTSLQPLERTKHNTMKLTALIMTDHDLTTMRMQLLAACSCAAFFLAGGPTSFVA